MKLSKEKIGIIVMIVILIGGLIFIGRQFTTPTTAAKKIDPGSNKHVQTILDKVTEWNKEKWEKSSYYLLKGLIQDYYADDLIEEDKYRQLTALLNTSYIQKLSDTTFVACSRGRNFNVINELDKELKKFEEYSELTQKSRQWIVQFWSAHKYAKSTVERASSEAYSDAFRAERVETISNKLESRIVRTNPYLNELLENAKLALITQFQLARKYDDCAKMKMDSCNCYVDFVENSYYQYKCDSFKTVVDSLRRVERANLKLTR